MTAQSFTGIIDTKGEWQKVGELTGITFTEGNSYSMQIQNWARVKVADAEFSCSNEKFTYKAASDELYIKTTNGNCQLTILENA